MRARLSGWWKSSSRSDSKAAELKFRQDAKHQGWGSRGGGATTVARGVANSTRYDPSSKFHPTISQLLLFACLSVSHLFAG